MQVRQKFNIILLTNINKKYLEKLELLNLIVKSGMAIIYVRLDQSNSFLRAQAILFLPDNNLNEDKWAESWCTP